MCGWQVETQARASVFLEAPRDNGCNPWNLLWKNRRIAPSISFDKKPRGRRNFFRMRPEILECNQMFFARPRESFCKIDNCRAPHINFERCFLDHFAICLEMKPRVGVRTIVYAHAYRAEIYG